MTDHDLIELGVASQETEGLPGGADEFANQQVIG